MKSAVIHTIKCSDNSIVASGRIAKFISEQLNVPLYDTSEKVMEVKDYDVIFWVNSPAAYCKDIEGLHDLCAYAKHIIFVQNDYHINIDLPSQVIRLLTRYQHRWTSYWTTIPSNMMYDGDAYINWNLLTFQKGIPLDFSNKEKGLFYYGACRPGRRKFFDEYFNDTDYNINISSTISNEKKFKEILNNKRIQYVKPFKSLKDLSKYKASIYIEDEFSNENYCSPANRFYELLSAGVAILFDKSTVKTMKIAGYDVSNYIIEDKNDVKRKLKYYKEIAKLQRKEWYRDYRQELIDQFQTEYIKYKKFFKLNPEGECSMSRGAKTRKMMPDRKLKIVPENLKLFFYWMYERQNIWHKRFILKQEPPWTDDKILKENKYTNVYRELDYNSQWLIRNVIKNKDISHLDMLWRILVFRYFNKPELFEFMGGVPSYKEYNSKVFEKNVLKYRDKFGRVFTDAYLINPPKKPEDREMGIDRFYCKHVRILHGNMKNLWKTYKRAKDPKELIKWFCKNMHCIAGFMAYEFYCDLCYTNWFKFGENDYVNVGPGAKFGIELIYPITHKTHEWEKKLRFLQRKHLKYFKKFGYKDFKFLRNEKGQRKLLTLRCIEHSLCEFSKFWKQRIQVGKQRQKFVPRKNSFRFNK